MKFVEGINKMAKKKVQKINLEDELKEWESATIQDLSEYDKWNLTVAKHNTTIKNTGNTCLYAPEEAAFKSKTDWSKLRSMKDEDIAYDEDNPVYMKPKEVIDKLYERQWRSIMAAPDVPDSAYHPVEYPKHYNKHPAGVECINIVEHYDFCVGNAIKYLWRAGIKSKNPLEDLKKAKWYIERKIKQLDKG